jgi:Ca2+-transporting ATPase
MASDDSRPSPVSTLSAPDRASPAGTIAWHQREPEEVLAALGVPAEEGLPEAEAKARLAKYGPNELEERGGRTVWHIVWEQISSTMIVILIVAGVLAYFFKGQEGALPVDSIAIFAIVLLFVVLGVLQEHRAQKAIAALKKMSVPMVRVVRGGRVVEVSSRDLVPGDMVRLETGSVVPADCRLVEAVNLRIQEAALTGESEPIEKLTSSLAREDLTLGDRRNMGYMGTFCSAGRGTAVVVATGMNTELGKIATMLQSVPHEQTPLQKKVDKLGKALAVIALCVAALVAIGGLAQGMSWPEIAILAIAIAVAIVPEGLPAVQTFALAIGAQRMLKRKALIRKLPAVETLGSVTVICSDKTGTLTQNRMTVTRLQTLDDEADFGNGDAGAMNERLRLLVKASALCNDAVLQDGASDGVGDPTEIALVAAARGLGMTKEALEAGLPRVHEYGFDSERKRMTTVHSASADSLPVKAPFVAFIKGAADQMLGISTHVFAGGEIAPMTEAHRSRIQGGTSAMARNGIRVLGVGLRGLQALPQGDDPREVERELVFLGLIGMIDPPRPEAREAVAKCRTAGIRPIMITGDHPETARYIATDLGMAEKDGRVVTGVELETMSVEDLTDIVEEVAVFARVSPEHKLRIVQALQGKGHIVAMTGDGVNDAPALKRADIGVAMGITGTDVAKEAADMVLVDDNFATIVNAVEEGRVVYDNLRRFVMFSIAGNVAKVMVVAIPPLLGMIAMLKPIQILFSNLMTDGLLGVGMGMEAAEKNTMRRPPYAPSDSIFARGIGRHIAVIGPLIGVLFIAAGWWQWNALGVPADPPDGDVRAVLWGTLMFTSLAFMQLGRALSSRSFREPLWAIPALGNPVLLGMIALVLALQFVVVFAPGVRDFMATLPLDQNHLSVAVGLAVIVLAIMEIEKAFVRRAAQRAAA